MKRNREFTTTDANEPPLKSHTCAEETLSDAGSVSNLEEEEDVCDTLVALKILNKRHDLVKQLLCTINVAFLHQLYTLVDDPSTVNQEVKQLRCAGTIRVLRVSTGVDEMALVMERDYVRQTLQCAHTTKDETTKLALEIFANSVLSSCHDLFITREDLVGHLSTVPGLKQTDGSGMQSKMDDVISSIVTLGLLIRKMDSTDLYAFWFGLPGLGRLLNQVILGRETLLRILRRTKYKEVPKSQLEKRKRIGSKCLLPIPFVLSDAIGKKLVLSIDTHQGKDMIIRMKNR